MSDDTIKQMYDVINEYDNKCKYNDVIDSLNKIFFAYSLCPHTRRHILLNNLEKRYGLNGYLSNRLLNVIITYN